MAVEIRHVQEGDAAELAFYMRPADVLELTAAGHPNILNAVCASIGVSTECRVALADGKLAAIFGVVIEDDNTGIMWCLGTPVIDTHKRQFIGYASNMLADFLKIRPTLYNYVDSRNALALKWLQYVGCIEGDIRPSGGTEFIRMTLHHEQFRTSRNRISASHAR